MTRSLPILFARAVAALAVVAIASAGASATASAATLNGKPVATPSTPAAPAPKAALPSRDGVLVVDWVDAKTSRISIGGITYALHNVQPRIVMADGSEATHVGYLRAGQSVRIVTASDAAGATRLAEIRVVAA